MKVIFHPTYGMNIDIQLSANARNVSPQLGPKFALDGLVPSFRTEHDEDYVLCVGMGHVPPPVLCVLYTKRPALPRWANLSRDSGARRTSKEGTLESSNNP